MLTYGSKILKFGTGGGKFILPPVHTPYLVFRFTNTSYTPTVGHGRKTAHYGTWEALGLPGYWKWKCNAYVSAGTGSSDAGWPVAFSSTASTPVGTLTPSVLGSNNPVSIIGYGGDLSTITSIDRMFANCTALTSFVDVPFQDLVNSSAAFAGCVNVEGGALDMYTSLSSLATPPSNHSAMFTNCGANTSTGFNELSYIPTGWGGNYAPVAQTLTLAVDTSRKYSWTVTADSGSLDFSSTSLSIDIYTTASMSQYAGINMRKTNIKWNSGSTPSGVQLYYYPCLIQCEVSGTTPGAAGWLALTENYNGTRTGSQASGDMPGTMDYNSFGALKYCTGTYDSTEPVHFAFFVTALTPSDIWTDGNNPLASQWGLLNNSYYQASTLYYL